MSDAIEIGKLSEQELLTMGYSKEGIPLSQDEIASKLGTYSWNMDYKHLQSNTTSVIGGSVNNSSKQLVDYTNITTITTDAITFPPEICSAIRQLGTGFFCDNNSNLFSCVVKHDGVYDKYFKNRIWGEKIIIFHVEDDNEAGDPLPIKRRRNSALFYTSYGEAGQGGYQGKRPRRKSIKQNRLDGGAYQKAEGYLIDFMEMELYHNKLGHDKVLGRKEMQLIDFLQDSDATSFYGIMQQIEGTNEKFDCTFVFVTGIRSTGFSLLEFAKIFVKYIMPAIIAALGVILPGIGIVVGSALYVLIDTGLQLVTSLLTKMIDGQPITLDMTVNELFTIAKTTLPENMQQYADMGRASYTAIKTGNYGALIPIIGNAVPPELRQKFISALKTSDIGKLVDEIGMKVNDAKKMVGSYLNMNVANSINSLVGERNLQDFKDTLALGESTIYNLKDKVGNTPIANLMVNLGSGGTANLLMPQIDKVVELVSQNENLLTTQKEALARLVIGSNELPTELFEKFMVNALVDTARANGTGSVIVPEVSPERTQCVAEELANLLADDGIQVIMQSADNNNSILNERKDIFPGAELVEKGTEDFGCPPQTTFITLKLPKKKACLDNFPDPQLVSGNNLLPVVTTDPLRQEGFVARPTIEAQQMMAQRIEQENLLRQQLRIDNRNNRAYNYLLNRGFDTGSANILKNQFVTSQSKNPIFDVDVRNQQEWYSHPILSKFVVGMSNIWGVPQFKDVEERIYKFVEDKFGEADFSTTVDKTDLTFALNNLNQQLDGTFPSIFAQYGLNDNLNEDCDAECRDLRKIYMGILSLRRQPDGSFAKDYSLHFENLERMISNIKSGKDYSKELATLNTLLQSTANKNDVDTIRNDIRNIKTIAPIDYKTRFDNLEKLINSISVKNYDQILNTISQEISTIKGNTYNDKNVISKLDTILEKISSNKVEKDYSSKLDQILSLLETKSNTVEIRIKELIEKIHNSSTNTEIATHTKEIINNRNEIVKIIENNFDNSNNSAILETYKNILDKFNLDFIQNLVNAKAQEIESRKIIEVEKEKFSTKQNEGTKRIENVSTDIFSTENVGKAKMQLTVWEYPKQCCDEKEVYAEETDFDCE